MPNTVNSYIETDLGNVSPNPRGEYNATYDYEYLDLIYYKGGSYVCLAPLGETIKNVPPIVGQTTTNWQCVAIPGDLTPEYISMYNEVVKDYNETNTNTADVAQMKDVTYASMTAAQESESKASTSETNARNSEVNAKQSMDKAKEYSDEAIRAKNDTQSLVTGFDEHVTTAISNAEASISESTDNAKGEIIAQKSSSLNEFRTDAETVMTNEKNMAITEIHQMVDSFSADADSKKQEVIQVADEKINDMTALKNDAVNAKNAAETAATTAVEKASETATYAGEAKSSSDSAKANADLVSANKIEIDNAKSDVESKVAQFESDLETYSVRTLRSDMTELQKETSDGFSALKGDLVKVNSKVDELANEILLRDIDGTKEGYEKAMRNWFRVMGYGSTPEEITALVTEWYKATREDWNGWVTFSKTSTSSDGVKGGDNADMVCIPSTDTVANRDDYSGNPLFAVTTINWILDEDGNPIISAIKGIHDTFEQNNPEKYVGVMQMSGYTYKSENDAGYTIGYTADPSTTGEDCTPLPEAIKLDGTVREFVVHAKYMSSTVGGKMTCCSGMIPTAFNSHNSLITLSAKNGALYSASTVTDWSFLVLMTMIKYASMTQDGKNRGCVSYNYQYTAALAESGVSRILLTDTQAEKLVVGSYVVIGSGGVTDRSDTKTRDISAGCTITSIEDVTVAEVTYKAVYVDADPFDTTTDTIISTWHWKTGTNDHVLGNDGSITSPSSGVYPAMIQGIEYAMGGYEVLADVILSIENGYYVPYVARKKEHQATSLTDNMHKSVLQSAQPESDAWNYIKRLSYDGELFFGTDTSGASSSTYTKDGFYKQGIATVSGLREWLAFGSLNYGSGAGGLSCLTGNFGLAHASWHCLARLSPNGNRGELAA